MRRKRLLLISLLLLVILTPVGGYFYFQPVRVEDLNRQEWCMCGPREVEFKNGSITLVATPHPEEEKTGRVIGSYTVEKDRLHITAPQNGGDYTVDHLGAHWSRPPGAENHMGGEFYDGNSRRRAFYMEVDYGWDGFVGFVRHDLRRNWLMIVVVALVGGGVWFFRKSRARKAMPQ